MTRRILASFLAVLVGLILLVVVPLGLSLSSQERRDFVRGTTITARSLAAVAEERLGDRQGEDVRALQLPAEPGDGVVLLDGTGRELVSSGLAVSPAVVEQVRRQRSPSIADAVVSIASVGEAGRPDGTVIVVRDAEPLHHRTHTLWLGLAAAAALALLAGALVAIGLARWIDRPLRELLAAATRMGEGDVTARTDERPGPPEVRAVATAFNEMAGRISSLLDSQRIMTLDVSHQIRTPLAALRLRLELLADDGPADLRAELVGALREIARLSRLADGLLAVARAEEVTPSPVPVDVAAVVRERVELWRPLAEERGVTLTADIGLATARATPGHLEQVLENLIANALDVLEPDGHIRVSVHTTDGEVVLTVADDGPGMTRERRDTAFARFVSDRSRPTKTGLGLAIVARLIAADHGTTQLQETEGGGLTAVVRLPSVAGSAAVPVG